MKNLNDFPREDRRVIESLRDTDPIALFQFLTGLCIWVRCYANDSVASTVHGVEMQKILKRQNKVLMNFFIEEIGEFEENDTQ